MRLGTALAAGLLSQATVDREPPHVSSVTVGISGQDVTVLLDEPCTGHTGFTLAVNGVACTLVYSSGDGTTLLVFGCTAANGGFGVQNTDLVTWAYAPGNVTDLHAHALVAASGSAVNNSMMEIN